MKRVRWKGWEGCSRNCYWAVSQLVDRIRTRVEVFVVVIRKLLFLVTSVILCGSEVTDQRLRQLPTTFVLIFRLHMCSYRSGFIWDVLFPRDLSRRPESYRYSVWLGTAGIDRAIFPVTFGDFIVVLAWECDHVLSSVARLSGALQRRTTAAGLLSFQEYNRLIGRSNYITQKGSSRSFIQYTAKTDRMNKMHSITKKAMQLW